MTHHMFQTYDYLFSTFWSSK